MSEIIVKETKINIVKVNEQHYICLTDMINLKMETSL